MAVRGRIHYQLNGVDIGESAQARRAHAIRAARKVAKSKGARAYIRETSEVVRQIRSAKSTAGADEINRLFGGASRGAMRTAGRLSGAMLLPEAGKVAMDVVAKGVGDRMAGEAKLQQSLMRRTRQLQQKRKAK